MTPLLKLPDQVGLSLLQTVFAFLAILFLTKLIGKQQVSEMTLYDYVAGITIGSIAAVVATDPPDKFLEHMLDLVVFVGLTILISVISVKSRPARRLIQGTPSVLVQNGQFVERNLLRNRVSIDDVKQRLRSKNVFDMSTIQTAILEPSGTITVLKKPEHEPVTRKDLHVQTAAVRLPVDVIAEGEVFEANLERAGRSRQWLLEELSREGLDLKDVFYAALDSQGKLYIDRRGDDPAAGNFLIDP